MRSRTRLVQFRISEDEYRQFGAVCSYLGARSISDLARRAVQYVIREKSLNQASSAGKTLGEINRALNQLELQLEQTAELVRQLERRNGLFPERGAANRPSVSQPKIGHA